MRIEPESDSPRTQPQGWLGAIPAGQLPQVPWSGLQRQGSCFSRLLRRPTAGERRMPRLSLESPPCGRQGRRARAVLGTAVGGRGAKPATYLGIADGRVNPHRAISSAPERRYRLSHTCVDSLTAILTATALNTRGQVQMSTEVSSKKTISLFTHRTSADRAKPMYQIGG